MSRVLHNESLPDWRDITDTPWKPQPIAWRHAESRYRKEALKQEVAAAGSHIVREVLISWMGETNEHPRTPLTHADHTAGQIAADTEFVALRSYGLEIPQVEWHTIEYNGTTRTLAKVPKINGETPICNGNAFADKFHLRQNPRQGRVWKQGLNNYFNSDRAGYRLRDIAPPSQWLYGAYDASVDTSHTHAKPRMILADIEPLFEGIRRS